MEERKLSKTEQQRKEKYNLICKDMEEKGYTKHDLTINVKKANILACFIAFPLAIIMFGIFWVVNRGVHNFESIWDLYIALAIFFVLVVVHEFIHGVTWAIFTKSKFKAISFGIIWKALTPYCTCSESLGKWQYFLGAAMPTLVLGIGIGLVAIVFDSFLWFVVAEFMIFGGGGDMLIITKLFTFKPKGSDVVFYDHPYECGLIAFEK